MATRCCVVTGCPASNQDFGTFLFSFPKAQKLRQQWIDALGKPESWIVPEPAFICWSHFDSRAIQQDESGFRRTADAVPSKYMNNGQLEYNSDFYCRFCARRLFSELMGNRIDEMNRSADGRKFLGLLLPEEESCDLSKLACDECIRHIQLTMRFIRNCAKATKELDEIAKFRSERNLVPAKEEIKTELDEFGEIPLNESLHSEVKIEASSLEGDDFVDSDDEDDDDVPLAVQFKQELKENDFKCSYCSFSSKKRIQLSSHMKKHRDLLPPKVTTTHENPKFSCTECEFVCDKLNQLASHKKKHKRMNRERPGTKGKTKCSISIEEGDLQDQQTSDSVDKPKSYSYASYSDGSDENAHTNDETDSVVLHCSECSYTCTRPIQLASHKKKHTGYQHKRAEWEEKRKVKDIYECEFCDFKCKLRRQMAGHRASHSELIRQSKPSGKEREHMCSICGKILSTRGAFFVHMKYHNDQRDYPCNICGKKFYSKRDVTMHVESLHEKKVYECEICGVKCTWKNALSKHMRKHDSKSYKLECSYCGKRFMAANELRLHVWRHTGQQLSCDICGAGYRFNFLLTQHKIRAHGIEVEGVKLYNRFKKDKMSSGKRKSNQPSHNNAPSESLPDTTSSPEMHEQTTRLTETRQAPVEDTTSYPADVPTGNYPHLMVPSSHMVASGDPHIPVPFHPLGSVMGQSMPPEASQSNIFHQVDNY
nr:zinc finger protein Xfin-like [Aedes albopictus]